MTWWITDTSIGQRLKFVRRFRRLTQKELGLLMGYSEKTADVRIAQYEKNARTPNAETTAKLAEVLKVSPVVFSPTICASREDLLQSMYWLFLMKGGGDIYLPGLDVCNQLFPSWAFKIAAAPAVVGIVTAVGVAPLLGIAFEVFFLIHDGIAIPGVVIVAGQPLIESGNFAFSLFHAHDALLSDCRLICGVSIIP